MRMGKCGWESADGKKYKKKYGKKKIIKTKFKDVIEIT